MKFFSRLNLFLIIASIFLSGCIVQSKQLSSLFKLLEEPPADLHSNRWLVRYSDYESIVFAVSMNDGILFSNNLGDQVFFDGWMVKKVKGMGRLHRDVTVYDEGNTRIFQKGSRMVSKHSCDRWQREKNLGVVRYSQSCGHKKEYKNSILLQKNGEISVIRQIVDERYTALTLSKLK